MKSEPPRGFEWQCVSLLAAALLAGACAATGGVIQVGPTRAYTTPSAAAAVAQNGDTIEIDAGLYAGNAATWTDHNLTIRGAGGMAHLRADGVAAGGKAIWVIQGTNTTVENIEFSGATVPDKNGAGIRQEGAGLTVRNCFFHDNEDGILAGDGAASEILIEHTHFASNGFGDGQSHNMYINHVKKFTLRHCYTHHAKVGHNVKSRAYENHILYNRIMDEADGTASYAIDLPNGGLSYVIGNVIQQGPNTANSTMLRYAAEGASNPIQELYIVNNTMVNDRSTGTFIGISGTPTALVANTVFVGNGTLLSGTGTMTNSLRIDGSDLVNRTGFDYHLVSNSVAIDAGMNPGWVNGRCLTPLYEYLHPANRERRASVLALDMGAHEHDADNDLDGMADRWEIAYFGSVTNSAGDPDADFDNDRLIDRAEYRAGTDPTNARSRFAITAISADGTNLRLAWNGVTDMFYDVESSTNLLNGAWTLRFANIAGHSTINVSTVNVSNAEQMFLRVNVNSSPPP